MMQYLKPFKWSCHASHPEAIKRWTATFDTKYDLNEIIMEDFSFDLGLKEYVIGTSLDFDKLGSQEKPPQERSSSTTKSYD